MTLMPSPRQIRRPWTSPWSALPSPVLICGPSWPPTRPRRKRCWESCAPTGLLRSKRSLRIDRPPRPGPAHPSGRSQQTPKAPSVSLRVGHWALWATRMTGTSVMVCACCPRFPSIPGAPSPLSPPGGGRPAAGGPGPGTPAAISRPRRPSLRRSGRRRRRRIASRPQGRPRVSHRRPGTAVIAVVPLTAAGSRRRPGAAAPGRVGDPREGRRPEGQRPASAARPLPPRSAAGAARLRRSGEKRSRERVLDPGWQYWRSLSWSWA